MDLEQQRALLAAKKPVKERRLRPLAHYHFAGSSAYSEKGRALIAAGKVGCILLAGGQGSRLGAHLPKGMVPVLEEKTLFQLFLEKTAAASKHYGRPLSLAIMTSPLNHQETLAYLQDHAFFGAQPVDLFEQEMLPLLDDRGNPLTEGPSGNGEVFKHFVRAGLFKAWQERGIEYIHVILVDNPLADPFDPELCGFHAEMHAQVTVKGVKKEDPEEKMGVILEEEGKVRVVEYSEISESIKRLPGLIGNTSLFCFSADFVQTAAAASLPWHIVQKEVKVGEQKVKGWKFETFIFDLLDYAAKIEVLVYPRNKTYAPLKSLADLEHLKTLLACNKIIS